VILALRALGVGDLATAVPALRGLRRAFPYEPQVLAAPTWLTPLIDLIGGIDRVVPVNGLTAPVTWPVRPRIAVNLHGSGPESHFLLRTAEPEELWAFTNPAAGHHTGPAWTDPSPALVAASSPAGRIGSSPAAATGSSAGVTSSSAGVAAIGSSPTTAALSPAASAPREEHEVARWVRLLRHYGVPADRTDLALAVPKVDVPSGVTIIHPGAKSPSRRWPPDRYATVAARLAAAGHRVLITGSAAERDLALRVADEAGLGSSAVPVTGLAELAALVAHARLLISGDTGIAHLATAYRTPSVTLFGPMSPARWGPPPGNCHVALWKGTRSEPGDAPGPGVHPALLAINPGEVLAAVEPGE
jgi:ADP-heptose:LPS heptosyltransferase